MEYRPNSEWQIFDPAGRRKYATAFERRRFLDAADNIDASTRALAYLLAFAGCRISEALSLTPQRIETGCSTVTFQTLKRRRRTFRTVPIPPEVSAMILAIATRPDDRVWKIHRATAWRHIKRLFAEARVTGPMACCRGLRHGYGIMAATSYVPPNLIQRWMGHAYASTTAIYLDAVGAEERQFAERMWGKPKDIS